MTIKLDTHEGLTISNFTYAIYSTYHVLNSQQIHTTVKIESEAQDLVIMHECTPFDLPNGIPTYDELASMTENYIQSLSV